MHGGTQKRRLTRVDAAPDARLSLATITSVLSSLRGLRVCTCVAMLCEAQNIRMTWKSMVRRN